jgi:hypothetical protein
VGTSRNDPSPKTPEWRPAIAILGRTDIPIERQSAELWSAAAADLDGTLRDDLSHHVFAEACEIAERGGDLFDALDSYDDASRREHKPGIAIEFGRRALARSLSNREGAAGFARELIAETAGYFASRDLPSYVGSKDRIAGVEDLVSLKDRLADQARNIASGVWQPGMGPERWRNYITSAIRELTRLGTRR